MVRVGVRLRGRLSHWCIATSDVQCTQFVYDLSSYLDSGIVVYSNLYPNVPFCCNSGMPKLILKDEELTFQ